jgi:UDP-N-acetylglucosamine diphosphorylase/glucosamine-1-phosphate N-acetyltransferase
MESSGIVFFDDNDWQKLLPLTYTRPMANCRIGILTIRAKWEQLLNKTSSFLTQDYLQEAFPVEVNDENILIKGNLLPNPHLVSAIKSLRIDQGLYKDDTLLAIKTNRNITEAYGKASDSNRIDYVDQIQVIERPEDFFTKNKQELQNDFDLLTKNRTSASIHPSNRVSSPENIFLEEGASIEHSILNADDGPIYIGKGAKILDGCMLRGGVALCEKAVLKMGAKIYGSTTIGPSSKLGGENKNVVIFGHSNKSHDGYLGNAVIGEWCNLGADTNASNLKNDYSEVKLWSYDSNSFRKTGTQFCGLIMADHSKTGINTMFNTGTVVGVCCNIFGAGYQKNFIPSFSWGGPMDYKIYKLEKALKVAALVLERRSLPFTDKDDKIFQTIFDTSAKYRK